MKLKGKTHLAPALARVAQSVHEDDGTLARGFGLDFVRISLHDDPLRQFLNIMVL